MKVNFTKRMLLAVSLAGGLTVATAAPVMPEHLAKLQRVENVSKFKSVPKQTLEAAEECAVFIPLPDGLQGWVPDICAACAPDEPVVEPNGEFLCLAPGG